MTTTAMAIGGVGTTSSRATVGDCIHRKAEASTTTNTKKRTKKKKIFLACTKDVVTIPGMIMHI
jgi:hypothetical protein